MDHFSSVVDSLDESMRVQVSEAVNGSRIVGRLFGIFGKSISLPQVKAYYPQDEFVEWHRGGVQERMKIWLAQETSEVVNKNWPPS